MTKQDLLDFSADHIGELWTVESHQAFVVGLRAFIAVREPHIRPLFHADGDPDDDAPRYHHSLIDPEAAEI